MAVYIDVLFAVNLIINYTLLLATAKIAKQHTSVCRLLLGALAGAIYAVCMFFPQITALYTWAAKIAVSFIIVAITFTVRKSITFFKTVAVFYITSFVFGGIVLGIFYFTGAGKGTVISNGIFYFSLPLRTLIISTGIAYCAVRILWKVRSRSKMRDYKNIIVYLNGKSTSLNGLIDTGNMLSDPITQTPVMIAEFESLSPILPDDFKNVFTSYHHDPESVLLNQDTLIQGLRIIPYCSLGNSDGLLLGFKPDAVKIEKAVTDNIIIGIYGSHLSKSKDYDALLNPEILSTRS